MDLPEDADQDEVDVAVERLRARMETAAARAGLTDVAVRVRTEIREGRVWVVGEVVPLPSTPTSEEVIPVIFGVDVSAYQPGFDFAAARREGYDFAIIKATEGTGWRSAFFADQLARARAAGLLVAAYHYVRGEDVDGQLRNIRSMVPLDVPVILDVEDGAGSIGSIRALNAAVQRTGYRTPLIYIPRWYWQGHMGSPDLSGLPPNWHSRYPDNTVRRKDDFVLGPEYWPTFGGLPTAVAQFTSSLAVANYPAGRIDGNAFRGTREEFAELLRGTQEDDMPLTPNDGNVMWAGTDPVGGGVETHPAAQWLAFGAFYSLHALRDIGAVKAMIATVIAGQQDDLSDTDVLARLDAKIDEQWTELENRLEQARAADRAAMEDTVRDVLGEDNAGQADEIVRKLGERLTGTETA